MALAFTTVATLLFGASAPAFANDATAPETTSTSSVLTALPDAAERVRTAREKVTAAESRVADARSRAQTTAAAITAAQQVLAAAEAELAVAEQQAAGLSQRERGAATALNDARGRLDALSARAYVDGGETGGGTAAVILASADPAAAARARVFVGVTGRDRSRVVDAYQQARTDAGGDAQRASEHLTRKRRDVTKARTDLEAAVTASQAATADLDAAQVELLAAWELLRNAESALTDPSAVSAPRTGPLDIPTVTFDAYLKAADWASVAFPACGLRWWGIAGVGKVESGHGTYRGAKILLNGDVVPHIVGIPLDGTNGTAAIPDSDGGVWDGDPVWDRAVGPTQFIPTTWAGYARRYDIDGDRDGDEDPFNVYDGARATAALLCSNTSSMADPIEMRRAYFAYNRSWEYVELVLAYALSYSAYDTVGPRTPEPPVSPEPAPA